MPRVPRINIEKALYYVTSRGDHNENIFREESDYRMYLDLLKRSKEQYKFKLFAFCLLPNHIHILLELTGESTISQIMYSLNSTYIKYFNSKYEMKGHLFQERYKLVIAEKEPNLLPLMTYIHLNPCSLNLSQDPGEYAYSSYINYENPGKPGVSNIDMREEISEVGPYTDFAKTVSKDLMIEMGGILTKKSVIGSSSFIEKVKSEAMAMSAKSQSQNMPIRSRKTIILAGSLLVLVMGVLVFYLYQRGIALNEEFKKRLAAEEHKMDVMLVQEKAKMVKSIDERYRADMVSFQAMSKRLEIEKKKAIELEAKLKSQDMKD